MASANTTNQLPLLKRLAKSDIGYFGDASDDDPLVDPTRSPELLARFPPTLLITGTRAFNMSPAPGSGWGKYSRSPQLNSI